jgi:DNA-binding winged helix-turn-helix (wHTH) protein
MSITITEQREQSFDLSLQTAAPALARPFSLGDWRVLPHLNRLQHLTSSEERQLEPRLVKLLCFLAANEHRVLSREELVQELWPRVIVNENSLTRAISELRKQLQSTNAAHPNYIETIPKRGYRLIPAVEFTENRQTASLLANSTPWSELLMQSPRRVSAAISGACLCLVIAGWLYQDTESLIDINRGPLLSDDVLNEEPDYLGGTLQLSTIEGSSAVVESIASPVVSLDERQYAFIQYDTSGSTIFLGGFGTAIEPVPVYYSNRQLFNLAWSPVGNNLLFARRPNVSTAAVFSPIGETAELLMLNLNTLETTRLVEDMSPADTEPSTSLNLT